jgi:hypothetical protein
LVVHPTTTTTDDNVNDKRQYPLEPAQYGKKRALPYEVMGFGKRRLPYEVMGFGKRRLPYEVMGFGKRNYLPYEVMGFGKKRGILPFDGYIMG